MKRAPGERSEPRRVVGLGGERSEPRRIAGRDFVRLILSFALGFVRVSFPRAIAVGFSLCGLTAASEMSDPPVEVRPALLWRLHKKPRRASRPLRRLRITRGAGPRRGIASPRPRRSDGKFLKILLIANQTDRLKIGAVTHLGAILCWLSSTNEDFVERRTNGPTENWCRDPFGGDPLLVSLNGRKFC